MGDDRVDKNFILLLAVVGRRRSECHRRIVPIKNDNSPAGPKKTFGLSQDGHRICHVADQGVGYHDIRTSVPNIDAVGVGDAKLDPGGNILLFGELTSSFDQILTDVELRGSRP